MSNIKEKEIRIHKLVLSLREKSHAHRRLPHQKVFLFSCPFVDFSYVLIIRIFYLQRFFDKTYKKNIMTRNLENSASKNSSIQEMGLRRSMRQNATIRGATSPPRVSTMGTTAVATSVATHGEVHGAFTTTTMGTTAVATSVAIRGEVHRAFTTARAMPSKAHGTKTTTQAVPSKFTWTQAQASHSHAPRVE